MLTVEESWCLDHLKGYKKDLKFLKTLFRGVEPWGEFGNDPSLESSTGIGWYTQFAGNVLLKLPHIQTNGDIYFNQATRHLQNSIKCTKFAALTSNMIVDSSLSN